MSKLSSHHPFHPGAGSFISHEEAHELVKNYADKHADKKHTVTRAIFYGADKIKSLLNTPGAVGIRVYYGLQPNPAIDQPYSKKMVLVAVDKDGYDIPGNPYKAPTHKAPAAKGPDKGGYLDDGVPCPDHCPGE